MVLMTSTERTDRSAWAGSVSVLGLLVSSAKLTVNPADPGVDLRLEDPEVRPELDSATGESGLEEEGQSWRRAELASAEARLTLPRRLLAEGASATGERGSLWTGGLSARVDTLLRGGRTLRGTAVGDDAVVAIAAAGDAGTAVSLVSASATAFCTALASAWRRLVRLGPGGEEAVAGSAVAGFAMVEWRGRDAGSEDPAAIPTSGWVQECASGQALKKGLQP